MQLLTRSLNGETFTSKLNDHNSNDWLLVFTGGGHTTLAAWTTGSSHTVTVSGWGTLHLTSTPFYVNPTLLPGDANLDGTVNVLDLAILAANYRKNVTGGWTSSRLQQRRRGGRPGPGPFGGQLPAQLRVGRRPGLRWIRRRKRSELLSLAGVTVVPEPGALVMLAVALIGALAYAWRKRK